MGVSAKFKIDSEANVAPIKTMQAELAKIPELLKAFHAAAESIVPAFQSASAKVISVASETEQKVSEAKKAATDKVKKLVEDETQTIIDAAKRAALLKSKAEQDYVALKSEYVLKGLDVTRQAIHEEEQKVKASRDAISRANQEHLDKDAVAVLKAERDKQNARLQGLRSVEKEITGARTFSEQLEKNVYEPINKEAAKGGALTKILFGDGSLKKKLSETESQVKAHEEQIATHAKEASQKIEAQEREHAAKLKQLEEQISTAKNAAAKKELEEVKHSIEQQIAEERKLTQAKAAEEQLQLQHHQATLEKSLNETKAEHAKASSGGESKGGGASALMQGAGIGAAVEGLTVLVEKSKEVSEANRALIAGTHATGEALEHEKKDAEGVANELGKTQAEVQTAMGHTAAWTHATGDELKKQTEAVVAFEAVHGVSAEKLMKTEEGRAKVFAEAAQNIAGAQMAAQDPALQAELAQKNVMEQVGKLANVLLTALAPILKEVSPLLQEMGEIAASILTPALSIVGPILEMVVTGLNFLMPILKPLIVVVGLLTAAIAVMNAVLLINPFVLIAVSVVLLIGIIVTMVKHWNEVVATIKKVFSAITDAGGAVLSFLGITSKAEAATRKHTDSLKENKKSLEDIKQASEDAAKASGEYTDALKKNNEEQEKSAKDMQDNAIAALRDIDAKLKNPAKRLKGDTEESLRATRALWVQHGKDGVRIQEQNEADAHAKALEIGAASDNDKKAAKDKSAKIDKDAYTAEKAAEDIRFGNDQLILERQLAAKAITKEQFDAKNEEVEELHIQKLNEIAANHRAGHEADAQKAEEALLKLKIAANEKQVKAEEAKLKKLEEAHNKEIELQKKRDALQASIEDAATQEEIAGIKDENAKALAEEKARYDKELTARAEDLGDMKLGKLLAESLEANHQNKMNAIAKKGEDERRKQHRETLDQITGASKVYDQAQQAINAKFFGPILDNWKSQKTFAMQALATITESLLGYVEQWLAQKAAMLATSIADSLLASTTTALAATEAAAAWAPAAISASIATLGAADAAGTAAFTAAQAAGQVAGHLAEGTDDWRGGLTYVGERGTELVNLPKHAQVIPNHHLPNLGAPPIDLSPVLHTLNMIHAGINRSNETFSRRPAPGVLIANDAARSAWNAGIKAEDRRSA